MGQGQSLNTLPTGPSAIETAELSDLTFERPLGGARFLRTVRARHQHGVVVVKVTAKPNPNVSFRQYAKLLKAERHALRHVPNVLPYQKIRETSSIGVLVRQFINYSLYDRISVRPFLESIEKKWIAFQLLCALRDSHEKEVFHGDIKSENVLVTSWAWVYLTDFASTFKPVYLPEDNPADFSYFYDTSARRTCYLAPERFLAAGQKPSEDKITWSMDVFSLGCVIAELFTETPTFTLSQLFRFRKGEYDPTLMLFNKIDDHHIRSLISNMIRLQPGERWHAHDYLDEYKGKAFPLYFYQHLHTLMQEVTDPTSGHKAATTEEGNNALADDRINRIYNDFEMLSVSLGYEGTQQNRNESMGPAHGQGLFPLQVDIPNDRHAAGISTMSTGDNGTFILLNVISSSLRGAARSSSKIRACDLLLAFAERLPDEAKLDRILPYVMILLDDDNDMVLVAALRMMTQILALIRVISPVNSGLFKEYVFYRLKSFVLYSTFKENPVVRATYAACLGSLAETAVRFLDMGQALRAGGSIPAAVKSNGDEIDRYAVPEDSYDKAREDLELEIAGQTKVFLTDSDTSVRRSFLNSVPDLCMVFGEAKTSDIILTHLNTYLNDPDWQLKRAFFKTIVPVAIFVGGTGLEEFILPLMLQALSDPQERVVEQVLRSLASMAEIGLLQRAKTWELIDTVARFQVHPNIWLREAAAHFVSAATTYLSMADIRILVAPLIKPYLKVPASNLSEEELLDALQKPLPRAALDLALQWAGKVDKSVFWKQAKDSRQLSYRANDQMPPASSVADLGPRSLAKIPKTDEDEQWLGRLRNAGMRSEDEFKILALREYLWRSAQRSKRDDTSNAEIVYDQLIALTKLNITPQTVIFDTDADLFNQLKEGQVPENQNLTEAIREAQDPSKATAAQPTQINGIAGETNVASKPIDDGEDGGSGPLKLLGLRRQTSGSGQSLSSSPSSGIGLLGKGKERATKHRSSASRILTGTDLKNKSLAEVATDSATATGKLNASIPNSRQISSMPNTSKKRPVTAQSRAGHNYAGSDPTILKLLDAVYVDNFPTDAAEFGPMVQPLKRGPIPSTSTHTSSTPWRPQGKLMTVLGEHSDKITRIVVAPDHAFFVTASEDGFVKVWDTSRLEKNVTHRSRCSQSLGEGIKVTSLCFIEATHTFICTGWDGSAHFFKVSVSETENGPQIARQMQLLRTWQIPSTQLSNEHAVWIDHFRGEGASTMVVATNLNRVMALDVRSMSVVYEFHNPAHHGTPTCFCIGRRHDWLLVGTTHGILDLWDLRFRLRLRSWQFPNAAPITRLQLHPSRKTARRNRICVSGGTAKGEVTVWDIEKVICHEIYRPAHEHSKERLIAKNYELRNLDDERSEVLLNRVAGSVAQETNTTDTALSTPVSTTPSYFGLYQVSQDSDVQYPFAVSGGPDLKVRFWDCDRLEGCRLVSGGGALDEKPTYTFTSLGLDTKVLTEKAPESDAQPAIESNKVAPANLSAKRSASGGAVSKAPPKYEAIRLSAQHLLDGHLDTITDVAVLERPYGMVLSADRSGQIFVHQ